jgi:hypothetical protein
MPIHVNDVFAQPARWPLVAGGLVALTLTVTFWNLGFIAAATFLLPVMISVVLRKSASSFNGYVVKRTRE